MVPPSMLNLALLPEMRTGPLVALHESMREPSFMVMVPPASATRIPHSCEVPLLLVVSFTFFTAAPLSSTSSAPLHILTRAL